MDVLGHITSLHATPDTCDAWMVSPQPGEARPGMAWIIFIGDADLVETRKSLISHL